MLNYFQRLTAKEAIFLLSIFYGCSLVLLLINTIEFVKIRNTNDCYEERKAMKRSIIYSSAATVIFCLTVILLNVFTIKRLENGFILRSSLGERTYEVQNVYEQDKETRIHFFQKASLASSFAIEDHKKEPVPFRIEGNEIIIPYSFRLIRIRSGNYFIEIIKRETNNDE